MKNQIIKRLSVFFAIMLVAANINVVAVDAAKPIPVIPAPPTIDGPTEEIHVYVGSDVSFNVTVAAISIRKLNWTYSNRLERVSLDYKTGVAKFRFTASSTGGFMEWIKVEDTYNQEATLELHFSVEYSPNNSPVINEEASDLSVTTNEDNAAIGTIVAIDNDPEDSLVYSIIDNDYPENGAVAIGESSGEFTYNPDPDYFGSDQFEVMVSDGRGGTDTVIVSITINAIDDPPMAVDDAAVTEEGMPVSIDVLANDTDIDGGVKMISSITGEVGGTISLDFGVVIFTPTAGAGETAGFDYTLNEGSTAHVTVTIQPSQSVNLTYVALGDSIPYGHYNMSLWNYLFGGTDTDSYVEQFARYLDVDAGNFHDESVSGNHTGEVLSQIGQLSVVIAEADVITLCVGANDIMDAAARGISGLQKYNIDWSVADSGRDDFDYNWRQVVNAIEELNPDVTLIVMTIYNPYKFDDSYYDLVDPYFSSDESGNYGLNYIISNFMSLDNTEYGDLVDDNFDYRVADIYSAFDEASDRDSLTRFYSSFCDPHPLQSFQNLIFETHVDTYLQY